MTGPKENTRPTVPTRTPKKKTPGIFDNLRKMPQPHPVEEMLGLISLPDELTDSTPSTPPSTPTPPTPSTTPTEGRGSRVSHHATQKLELEKLTPIAPERDFSKVANSIVREAVPSGIFGGKSKQLYDYLYSLTRGAIVPRRTVRISKEKLMKGAGIGSEVTLRTNLMKLSSVNLVIERIHSGTHGGNEYEIILPEEVTSTGTTPSTPPRASTGSSSPQFREPVEGVVSTPSRASLSQAESISYEQPKTSFKTNTEFDDDEAFADMNAILRKAAKEVTGKAPMAVERERWKELGELIAAELKIAASRTTVSNVPAFLTAHLRRRLFKRDNRQIEREVAEARADEKQERESKIERPPHLEAEQIQEQVNLMVELMQAGRTIESLDEQFGGSFRGVQWHMIRGMTLAQFKVSKPSENETALPPPTKLMEER